MTPRPGSPNACADGANDRDGLPVSPSGRLARAAGAAASASAATFPHRRQRRGSLSAPVTVLLPAARCAACGDSFVPQLGRILCERHA